MTIVTARLRKIDSPRISGTLGLVYLVVAQTKLIASSGWYTYLRRDDAQSSEQWKEDVVRLEAGDDFAWRGEYMGKPSHGEGGLMLVIMFR